MDKNKAPEVSVDEDEASVEGHASINNRPLDAGPANKASARKPVAAREPRLNS
jgi:hypothetical protein